jgi:hypothetical protein
VTCLGAGPLFLIAKLPLMMWSSYTAIHTGL